jgi:dTDP-4-amino-4,6-dideoxygalactose transaminase
MNPFEVVRAFEERVATYTGAPYAVAVDSCTNALFLSLVLHRIKHGKRLVILPCKTYVGVAHAVVNAGHRCAFREFYWAGAYSLVGTNVVDAARRFHEGMYDVYRGTLMCLSFHSGKHLPLENGGMILLDSEDDYKVLRRMRYDGRGEGVAPVDDIFDAPGYHCLMMPSIAARGLEIMPYVAKYNDDLSWDDYADLSKHKYFVEVNRD